MRGKFMSVILVSLVLLLAVGCSTKNVGTTPDPLRDVSRFTVALDPGCFFDGASVGDVYLTSEDYDTHVRVDVNVRDARGLKALYFEMTYDAEKYRPMIVEPTDALGPKADLLKLTIRGEPGRLVHGHVLTKPQWRTGFTGDGTLATVSFRKEPALTGRAVSVTAKDANSSSPDLTFGVEAADTLAWSYYNKGDYNQNGLVEIADLTPLGQNYGEGSPPALFPIDTIESVVDGNEDGLISILDITQIGQNWQQSAVGGFNVYASADFADYPGTVDTAGNGGATMLANVALPAVGTGRTTLSYVVAAPVANDFYWVRPVDTEDSEGIASNWAGGNPADMPELLIIGNEPTEGTGVALDPYVNCQTEYDYIFQVNDIPGGVDVTTQATFNVAPPAAGSIDPADGILNIPFGFDGAIQVSAIYDSLPSNVVYMNVPPPGAEGLYIMPDSTDTDWDDVVTAPDPGHEGDDPGTEFNPYVVRTDIFNADGSIAFSLAANTQEDGSGTEIPVGDLDWDAVPEFIVADGTWPTPGEFQIFWDSGAGFSFTNGYVFALDPGATPPNDESNPLYIIALDALPE